MELTDLSYTGAAIDDAETLLLLPNDYRRLLEQVNGFIQFGGGLHIRGVCTDPLWHSLRAVWREEYALHRRYAAVTRTDIPFGQDALGDQFLLRGGEVLRLSGETGDVEPMDCVFFEFLTRAQANPLEYLNLHPLTEFQRRGGRLEPGQLLSAYPPFCTKEAKAGVSLKAVPALEQIGFLADFAAQIAGMGEGQPVRLRTD